MRLCYLSPRLRHLLFLLTAIFGDYCHAAVRIVEGEIQSINYVPTASPTDFPNDAYTNVDIILTIKSLQVLNTCPVEQSLGLVLLAIPADSLPAEAYRELSIMSGRKKTVRLYVDDQRRTDDNLCRIVDIG